MGPAGAIRRLPVVDKGDCMSGGQGRQTIRRPAEVRPLDFRFLVPLHFYTPSYSSRPSRRARTEPAISARRGRRTLQRHCQGARGSECGPRWTSAAVLLTTARRVPFLGTSPAVGISSCPSSPGKPCPSAARRGNRKRREKMFAVTRLLYRRTLNHSERELRTGRRKRDTKRRTSATSAVSVFCEESITLSAPSRQYERVRRFYYPFVPTADRSPGVAPPGRKAPDCNRDNRPIARRPPGPARV
jgi:hypothetical protein